MTNYRVQLDVYNGPLDLLLYLIRREEVHIFDIPIAHITDQYIAHVDLLKTLDPDAAANFLVLAATLMEIKSRMLLPRPPAEEEGEEDFEDPRLELVKQLLEYKTFKDAASSLAHLGQEQARRFQRHPGVTLPDEPEFDLEEAQIWDLFSAFNKLMAEVGYTPTAHEVLYDDTPISLYAVDIQDQLTRENGSLRFDQLFEGRNKSEMIGLFLALLELIRQKRLRIESSLPAGSLTLHLLDETPITEASLQMPPETDDREADVTDGDEEPEPAFNRGGIGGADRDAAALTAAELGDDEEDDEIVDEELAAIDAALLSMTSDIDEQREKFIKKIDRDIDVQSVTNPLPDESPVEAVDETSDEAVAESSDESAVAPTEGSTPEPVAPEPGLASPPDAETVEEVVSDPAAPAVSDPVTPAE